MTRTWSLSLFLAFCSPLGGPAFAEPPKAPLIKLPVAFGAAMVFYNSYLPNIASEDQRDRV